MSPKVLAEKKYVTRPGRRRSKDDLQEGFGKIHPPLRQDLPKVPSTDGLNSLDIQIASLFAQHRPISLSTPIPSETSSSDFASIFDFKWKRKTSSEEVILTLNSVFQDLEQSANTLQSISEESDVRTTLHAPSKSSADLQPQHLDIPAKVFHINLQDISKKFMPFLPPPPPVPLAALQEAARKSIKEPRRDQNSRRKTYTTTLTVHEITHKNGKATYETHSTPLIEDRRPSMMDEISKVSGEHQGLPHLKPAPPMLEFLERMRERRVQYYLRTEKRYSGREILRAISVKRQRKLKMKKHKYKKLMKRTKNLRRRLDRT